MKKLHHTEIPKARILTPKEFEENSDVIYATKALEKADHIISTAVEHDYWKAWHENYSHLRLEEYKLLENRYHETQSEERKKINDRIEENRSRRVTILCEEKMIPDVALKGYQKELTSAAAFDRHLEQKGQIAAITPSQLASFQLAMEAKPERDFLTPARDRDFDLER